MVRAQAQEREALEAVVDDLDKALEAAEDDRARYHIRQAAQRLVAANADPED